MTRFLKMLVIGALLLLAACQQGTPTQEPTGTPPTDVTAQPLQIDLSGVEPTYFRFTYNDPVAGEFKTAIGTTVYSKVRNLTNGYLLNLTPLDTVQSTALVPFAIPESITPGTYALNNYDYSFSADGKQIVSLGVTIAGIANFFELHEGTITISSVDPLTGAFKFTGIAEVSETQNVEVTVEGVLNEIALVNADATPSS